MWPVLATRTENRIASLQRARLTAQVSRFNLDKKLHLYAMAWRPLQLRAKFDYGPCINPKKGLALTLVQLQWRENKSEKQNLKASSPGGKSFGDSHTFIFWRFLPWEGRCSGKRGVRSAPHRVCALNRAWRHQALAGSTPSLLPSSSITEGPRLP